MDDIGLVDADALAEVVSPHRHVARFLCGHLHRPIIASFAGKVMTLAPSTGHQVVLDLTEDGPAMFNFEDTRSWNEISDKTHQFSTFSVVDEVDFV